MSFGEQRNVKETGTIFVAAGLAVRRTGFIIFQESIYSDDVKP